MVKIVKLPQNRWKDFQKLRLEALESDPAAFGSSYEKENTFPKEVWQSRIGNILFAVLNDTPVGMIGYYFEDKIKTKHIANIYGIYVTKAYRNHGIGGELIASAISAIKENKDILKIKLTVNPERKFALKLYKKHGFSDVGTFRNELCINGRFYDELLMERPV